MSRISLWVLPMLRASAAILVLALGSNLGIAQAMFPVVSPLSFRVTDAEFSKSLGKIVAVSSTPTTSLHIYDPRSRQLVSVRLTSRGHSVSIHPDGLSAAVAQQNSITLVDLVRGVVLRSIPVSVPPGDIVLAGNGFVYCLPAVGQRQNINCVQLSSGAETFNTGGSVRQGTLGKLHASGDRIYGADNGVSPSDIEVYDVRGGTATYRWESSYHGQHLVEGDLWLAEDGKRAFVRGGNVFTTSAARASDLIHVGRLANLKLIESLDVTVRGDRVVAIPEKDRSGVGADERALQLYENSSLNFVGEYDFPKRTVAGKSFDHFGRFVFLEDGGAVAWSIVQADPQSGVLWDYGVVGFDTGTVPPSLRGTGETVSIFLGGTQTLSLDAGPGLAGHGYFLLGSAGGTWPGIRVGSVLLPLNFERVYILQTFTNPNRPPLTNSMGRLDANGRATAMFSIAPRSVPKELLGLVLHHAFLVDVRGAPGFASNAVPVRFTF